MSFNIKRLTVALIIHGDPPLIKDTLCSILSEQNDGIEIDILAIDDGSSPNAIPILKKYGAKIHTSIGSSISYAKNFAINNSTSDIVFFVDDHMILKKGWLIGIVESFRENKNLTGVCGYYSSNFNDANILRDIKRELIYNKNKKCRNISMEEFTTFSTGLCAFHRQKLCGEDFHEELFPPDFGGEDFPTNYRLLERANKFYYTPSIEATHHHNLNWLSFLKKIEIEVRGRFSIYYWATANNKIALPHLQGFLNFPLLALICLLIFPICFIVKSFKIPAALLFLSFFVEVWHTLPVLAQDKSKYIKPKYLHFLTILYILASDYLSVICFIQYIFSTYKRPFKQLSYSQVVKFLRIFIEWEKHKILTMLRLRKKCNFSHLVEGLYETGDS